MSLRLMTRVGTSIAWLEWGPAAFDRAARDAKPILLSLVAPWCEECAIMDRAVYASAVVASRIDQSFVPVRVDTDRRPDINERYNLGGWPTTVFLTPTGEILGGGTFITRDQMPAVLAQVADAFASRGGEIGARSRGDQFGSAAPVESGRPPATATARDAADPVEWISSQLIERFDPDCGGFGDAAKFPYPAALTLALDRFEATGDSRFARIVIGSLDGIARLYDQRDGGFFRYASRRDWSQPRTEKILFDNALLIRLYLDAGAVLEREDYVGQAVRALEWVQGTLASDQEGGFSGSVSADSEYYAAGAPKSAARVRPAIDRTQYTDSTAAMISTYFRAFDVTGEPDLRKFALKSIERTALGSYQPGAGVAHIGGPDPDVRGLLVDQVSMIDALVRAHAASGQLPYSMLAAELMEYALNTMWDSERGGFRDRATSESDSLGLLRSPLRPFVSNCEAAQMLSRLSTISGRASYRSRAEETLASLGDGYREDPLAAASYALALREVRDRRVPLGLSLSFVDWRLGEPDEDH